MPKKEFNASQYDKELKGMKMVDRSRLYKKIQEALNMGAEELVGESEAHKALYRKIRDDMAEDRSVTLPAGSVFEPIPSPDPTKRQIWRCSAVSGAGKSYLARSIAENYLRLFPDREVYLISQQEHDETLDNMKPHPPKRIDYTTFATDPPSMDEFEKCLIIFDDVDCIPNPHGKAVLQLIDEVCMRGRHTVTSAIICTHYLSCGLKTRLSLSEAHYLCIYPFATSPKAMEYALTTYAGMTREQIQKLRTLNSRWVIVSKQYPTYVLAETCAYMLN